MTSSAARDSDGLGVPCKSSRLTVVHSAGLTAEDVHALKVEVDESKSGIDPATAFILIHLAGGAVSAAGAAGAKLFWSKVILPRVRKAKRADAIGDQRAGDGTS